MATVYAGVVNTVAWTAKRDSTRTAGNTLLQDFGICKGRLQGLE